MILVFGKTGQVSNELQHFGNVVTLDRYDVDLSNPDKCIEAIQAYKTKAVINAAAFTAVDKAENDEAAATIINGDAPTAMAKACVKLGIPLVHLSTDYVFDGKGQVPWKPTDAVAPLNAYGRSKLAGERGIIEHGPAHAILRTSWVVSSHGTNFVKTMLRLSENCHTLKVIADQIGGPTPARNIAEACLQITDQLILDPSKSGTYHFSGAPDVSWADFAKEIFSQAEKTVSVTPVKTEEYYTPAVRPMNSRMDCNKTELVFGISRPDWRKGLNSILKELRL